MEPLILPKSIAMTTHLFHRPILVPLWSYCWKFYYYMHSKSPQIVACQINQYPFRNFPLTALLLQHSKWTNKFTGAINIKSNHRITNLQTLLITSQNKNKWVAFSPSKSHKTQFPKSSKGRILRIIRLDFVGIQSSNSFQEKEKATKPLWREL